MTEIWWTFWQASNYLLAHYPCDGAEHAYGLIESKIQDGTLRTRRKDPKSGEYFEIRPHEWHRSQRDDHVELEGADEWVGAIHVEYVGSEVQKLRAVGPETSKNRGGRPPKNWEPFWLEVIRIADHPDGLPERKADLQRQMLEWCEENMADAPRETSVRDKVSMIYKYVKPR